MKSTRNICLTIAYDGTDFCGWQRQPDRPTIQACLEDALAGIVGAPVTLWGSGRTDAGVHALGQKANFKTATPIPCPNLMKALNDVLPPTIRVKEGREVADDFHARCDVRSKTYRYRILQTPLCSPFLWRFVYHHPYPLNRQRMAKAARLVLGERDFTSFAAAGTGGGTATRAAAEASPGAVAASPNQETHGLVGEESSPYPQLPMGDSRRTEPGSGLANPESHSMVRTIFCSRLLWRPQTSMLLYEVRGDGFLHHMVRNIVGTLLEVGRGKFTPEDVSAILAARDRTKAGPTAPAQGLCLVKVEY
jgi:tRNA pseudouridine38-40 synthase